MGASMKYDKWIVSLTWPQLRTSLNRAILIAKFVECPLCGAQPGYACRALDPPHDKTGIVHVKRGELFIERASGDALL